MEIFKNGDEVVRTGNTYESVVKGGIYTILSISGGKVYLEEIDGIYDEMLFKLIEDETLNYQIY